MTQKLYGMLIFNSDAGATYLHQGKEKIDAPSHSAQRTQEAAPTCKDSEQCHCSHERSIVYNRVHKSLWAIHHVKANGPIPDRSVG